VRISYKLEKQNFDADFFLRRKKMVIRVCTVFFGKVVFKRVMNNALSSHQFGDWKSDAKSWTI